MSKTNAKPNPPALSERANDLLAEHHRTIWVRTDRMFAALLVCEWLAGVLIAAVMSPWTYAGGTRSIHPHLLAATLLGGLFVTLPIFLAFNRPGTRASRHAAAVSQMLMSALLIHLGDGRIEMHFIIFGSFAFLAFYRDWRVLLSGVIIVASDHMLRGFITPESVYGVTTTSGWRTFEHAGWVVFENIFLIASCVQGEREMAGIAQSRAMLEASHRDVEQKVTDRTRELKQTQDELLKAARSAGMAEIATSVLHNVGNVLNSVNVSATVVVDKLKRSDVPSLGKVSGLLSEHDADVGSYLTNDARGKLIPGFIAQLAGCLAEEQTSLITEMESLTRGVDHIKQIVAAQQSMAKKSNVRTSIEPARLMEAAISMNSASMPRDIEIRRNIAEIGPLQLDEHKIMQILVNLIRNAQQAVTARGSLPKLITLGVCQTSDADGQSVVEFAVTDTGVGIAAENIDRIFAHGFTTKADGHGFGLHSAANAASEMNGSLRVTSTGIGHGATFTLTLPASADDAIDVRTAQEQLS